MENSIAILHSTFFFIYHYFLIVINKGRKRVHTKITHPKTIVIYQINCPINLLSASNNKVYQDPILNPLVSDQSQTEI